MSVELILHVIAMTLKNHNYIITLRKIQKGIFLIIPYLSFFHGQQSFFGIALKNSRCRKLPDLLHEFTCLMPVKDVCCGKYYSKFIKDFQTETRK